MVPLDDDIVPVVVDVVVDPVAVDPEDMLPLEADAPPAPPEDVVLVPSSQAVRSADTERRRKIEERIVGSFRGRRAKIKVESRTFNFYLWAMSASGATGRSARNTKILGRPRRAPSASGRTARDATPKNPVPKPPARDSLVKMATLAKESGVPSATIKHYIREGLLPAPPLRTSRNMAYYDRALVPRIRAIKALQSEHFLPLKIIRDILAGRSAEPDEDHAARAIQATLNRMVPERGSRTRARLVAAGLPEKELDFFRALGLVTPVANAEEETYDGDDLELLRTLGHARRAGITADMLPFTALEPYAAAIRALVAVEIDLLRKGILPRAKGRELDALLEAATVLSERLVVLLRRRMILPTLRTLGTSEHGARAKSTAKKR